MGILHHRAIIKGRDRKDLFWRSTLDTGFPYGTKWEDSEKVVRIVNNYKSRYEMVEVDVTDAEG